MAPATVSSPPASDPDHLEALAPERLPGFVSVVIPAFNEQERIERTVQETAEALKAFGHPYEIVIVDDGSSDDTLGTLRALADGRDDLRFGSTRFNVGKGSALIRGMQLARGDVLLFTDADLEVHPRQFGLLWDTMVDQDADVVIGSKLHPEATVDYPLNRRVMSQGYYALVKTLFGLPVRDTQTGLKLYKREVIERLAPMLLVKRFAHDLEALVLAHRFGYRIAEAPVVVTREREYVRVGSRDVRNVTQDTLAIWYRASIRRYYDRIGRHTDRALGIGAPPGWEREPSR